MYTEAGYWIYGRYVFMHVYRLTADSAVSLTIYMSEVAVIFLREYVEDIGWILLYFDIMVDTLSYTCTDRQLSSTTGNIYLSKCCSVLSFFRSATVSYVEDVRNMST